MISLRRILLSTYSTIYMKRLHDLLRCVSYANMFQFRHQIDCITGGIATKALEPSVLER